ncbi:hypothetical protein VKT23_009661 [Stygiomarasmius scandens]|uniref:Uncharacterized protein n=1 Tax=Marasmiellus scandens TaxID=2682957 RepID=A0ABR1JKB8_9AGAR
MSLSAEDQEILPVIGRSTYQNMMGVVVESATWGSYALLFAFAVFIQVSNGLKATRNKVVLGVTCLLFTSSTVLLALNVTWAEISVHDILLVNPTEPLTDKVDNANARIIELGTPMEALFLLNMIVGDAVVIWRAYVIWSRKKRIIVFPVICLLASLGFAITDVICLTASEGINHTSVPTGSRVCTWSEPIAWALSLLTNFASTSLIAVQAWIMRQDIKKAFDGAAPNKRTWRAMALLIESGFIYCVFWMSELIIFFDIPRTSNAFYVWQFFASIGDQLSGIYPTAIIVIVSLQQTFDETVISTTVLNTSSAIKARSRIVFASKSGTNNSGSHAIEIRSAHRGPGDVEHGKTLTSVGHSTEMELDGGKRSVRSIEA